MTHQEFEERLDTAATKSSPDEAKQAIRELLIDVTKEAEPNWDDFDDYNRTFLQGMFRGFSDELRTTITGKEGE